MRRWPAGALFFAGWIGFLGVITWLDLHNAFLLLPYWPSGVVLLALAAVPVLLLWRYDYHLILRIPLVCSIVWLLMLPFMPSAADIALEVAASRIQIGMTEAEVRSIMASYSPHQSGFAHPNGVEGVEFCSDWPMCETSAQVQFATGRVVRAWVDTD